MLGRLSEFLRCTAQPPSLSAITMFACGAAAGVVTAVASAIVLTPPHPFLLMWDVGALETSLEVSGAFPIASRVICRVALCFFSKSVYGLGIELLK